LWNAYSTSGGPSAQSSARQPESRPSSHAVSSPNGAISNAEYSRKPASVSASNAPAQIISPVSTGYSTVPPTSAPFSVMAPDRYGNTCLSMSRPSHRYWMSE
jgi:hypothetical protein